MKKFSILLLIYNAELKKIIYTLKSILEQEFKEYEIIFCDDCSKNDYKSELKEILSEYQYEDYFFVRNEENVGTVKNISNGLQYATGKYIKLIGAGDLLYNKDTLEHVYQFMEDKSCECCFGYMQGFSWDNGEVKENEFFVPCDLSVYTDEIARKKKIMRNITVYEDWVSGASMFMSKSYLSKYIDMMVGRVFLYEDWLQALGILDEQYFQLLDEYVVWYEMGEGISTSSNSAKNERIRRDSNSFWKIYDEYYKKLGITGYEKENKKRNRKKKCDEIENYSLRLFCKAVTNIDIVIFFMRNKRKRSDLIKSKRSCKGFLDDKSFY